MTAPGSPAGTELQFCFQIAKVTRPLISVTKMTEKGELQILCRKDEALVLDSKNKTVATFARKGGLYVAVMKVRNRRFSHFPRPDERSTHHGYKTNFNSSSRLRHGRRWRRIPGWR